MNYCSNCGKTLSESDKFCSSCGTQVSLSDKNTNSDWSIEDFLENNPPNEKGIITCPVCMGEGLINDVDIKKLSKENDWIPGECPYCDAVGSINVKKLNLDPLKLNFRKEHEDPITNPTENNDEFSTKLLTVSVLTENNELKYGKVNVNGKVIIDPIFDYIYDEDQYGFYRVEINQKYGYVDSKGNWVIPAKYDLINTWKGINKDGSCIISENNKEGVIDPQGNWILNPIYDQIYSEQIVGSFKVKLNEKYGLVNKKGEWVFDPIYDSIDYIDEKHLFIVCLNAKCGIIDYSKNWIIEPKYEYLRYTHYDHFIAQIDQKYGIIDTFGNWVVSPSFDDISFDMTPENYIEALSNGKLGFINLRGEWVIEPIFDYIGEFHLEKYWEVEINGKYGLYSIEKRWVIDPIYDFLMMGYSQVCLVKENDKYGVLDLSGQWIVQPIYDSVNNFIGDLIILEINKKFGCINSDGKLVIPFIYDSISPLDEYGSIAEISEKFGIIDSKGNWITQPIFDTLEPVDNGLYKAVENENYGFIDSFGNWKIPPIYSIKKIEDEDEDEDEEENDFYLNEEDENETENTINFEPYFSELVGKEKIYLEENIPEKKYNAFTKNFSKEFINNSNCLVYYDNTLWGKGDDGFAIVKHSGGSYFLLLKEFGSESIGFCLGENQNNPNVKGIEYSDKTGMTITSYNPEDKLKYITKHFTADKVIKALCNCLNSEFYLENFEEENDEFIDPANIRN